MAPRAYPASLAGSPPEMAEPRVSVVMIFLDAARFMEESIESVLAQTFGRWELLLVDDGSTDGSTEIARRYAERHPGRIRYLEHDGHQNRGMSASRNRGIRHARGEYIALLDADDVYLPEKLEHQVGLLEAHPDVGMVYGVTEYWYSWTGAPDDAGRDRPRKRGVRPGNLLPPGALLRPLIRDVARTPCTCGVVMRKSAVTAAGGFETRFKGMFEDQVFFLKMCLHSRVLIDGRCLDRYRQHPDSCCSTEAAAGRWERESELSEARHRFLEWLEEFLTEEAQDPTLLRQIRRELLPYRHPSLLPAWKLLAPFRALKARWNRRLRSVRSGP